MCLLSEQLLLEGQPVVWPYSLCTEDFSFFYSSGLKTDVNIICVHFSIPFQLVEKDKIS